MITMYHAMRSSWTWMSCKLDEEFCHCRSSVIRHFVVTERNLGVLYVHLSYLLAPDSLLEFLQNQKLSIYMNSAICCTDKLLSLGRHQYKGI